MRYSYLLGVALLFYFAFMYLAERLWMKDPRKAAPPSPFPSPAPKSEAPQGKAKKGKQK